MVKRWRARRVSGPEERRRWTEGAWPCGIAPRGPAHSFSPALSGGVACYDRQPSWLADRSTSSAMASAGFLLSAPSLLAAVTPGGVDQVEISHDGGKHVIGNGAGGCSDADTTTEVVDTDAASMPPSLTSPILGLFLFHKRLGKITEFHRNPQKRSIFFSTQAPRIHPVTCFDVS
ncbi:MAG: hypothetical protein Q8Q20_00450 [bacterium]|nr:hypothetical protein [bacterium]